MRSLRVCPERSHWVAQLPEHEADGCELKESESFVIEALPVLGQPAASPEPGKCSLDDPAFGQNDETMGRLVRTFDDLDVHLAHDGSERALEFGALITTIGIELQQERIETEQRGHHKHAAIAVLDVGSMHDGVHQEAFRIDENVALLALDFLARIIAMGVVSPPFSALFTLWLSMMAAVGDASRSALSRHST